jgi:L-threonylcarbamoyladenylate synthase
LALLDSFLHSLAKQAIIVLIMMNSQFLTPCSANAIQKAAEQLIAGHLVAFPTETVYGLGADATNEQAVNRVYEVKGRPTNHPLIVHVSSLNALGVWAKEIPDYAISLGRVFWPGPMTLILKRQELAQDYITGSQDSVGIRVPSNPIALELLRRFESLGGLGVAAPSANRFGRVSPTSAQHVQDEIGKNLIQGDLIIDGGNSDIGIESTIIDCRNDTMTILRPGAITAEIIKSTIGINCSTLEYRDFRVSGALEKHYAPNAKVLVNQVPIQGQALMALSSFQTPDGVYRISSPENVSDFARLLYSSLRRADELGFDAIVILIPVGQGMEIALKDRVSKAANGL